MSLYAEITIHAAVPTAFHYRVPESLEGRIQVGHLVNVGVRSGRQPGVVIGLSDTSPVAEPKTISGLLDPNPVMSATAVRLARRLADEYMAPIGLCVWLWIPPNLIQYAEPVISLLDSRYAPGDALEHEVLTLLKKRGPLRYAQFQLALKHDLWRDSIDKLNALGVVDVESTLLPPRPRAARIQTAALAFHPAALDEALKAIPESLRRADILRHVLRVLSRETAPMDVGWVYAQTGAKTADLQRLAELDLVELDEKRSWRDQLVERDYIPAVPPRLTDEQLARMGGDREGRRARDIRGLRAVRRDRQRQDRSIPARHRRRVGARPSGDLSRAGDRPHRPDDPAGAGAFSGPRGGRAQPLDRCRTRARVGTGAQRRNRHRRRAALGIISTAAGCRAGDRRRGARQQLSCLERAAVRQPQAGRVVDARVRRPAAHGQRHAGRRDAAARADEGTLPAWAAAAGVRAPPARRDSGRPPARPAQLRRRRGGRHRARTAAGDAR
ncbi:MAG: hypothetical protein HND48_00275 [Chloroflexi bacterium]|nr:hypothetical protein [Chloroflexota bacterium]